MESIQMPIIKQNISDQVVEYIKKNISDQVWKVNEKIPSESELIKLVNVSRSSIRAAIRELIGLGILESKQGKGTFLKSNNLNNNMHVISQEDCQDVSKVLEFRLIMEPGSCYIAVQNSTHEIINKLQDHLNDMRNSIGNPSNYIVADMQFHEVICQATGNPLIEKALHNVFQQTIHSHKQLNDLFGYDGIYYHKQILDAFFKKDCKAAARIMKEHLQHAQINIKKFV